MNNETPNVAIDTETAQQLSLLGVPAWLVAVIVLAMALIPVVIWVLKPWRDNQLARGTGMLIVLALGIALAGCGSFSQARVDDLENAKRNHAQDVERAMQDKLSAVELRSSLASIDTALLAEYAHRGAEADLEAERVRLEAASDALVAALFDGDTGR